MLISWLIYTKDWQTYSLGQISHEALTFLRRWDVCAEYGHSKICCGFLSCRN